MANNLVITFFVTLLLQSWALNHQGFEIREVFPKEDGPQQSATFLLEIDLGTCLCRNLTTACEIAIAKSTILEITCAQDELYCCTGRPKTPAELQPLQEEGRSLHPAIVSTFPDDYDETDQEDDKEPQTRVGEEPETPKINGNYRLVPILDPTNDNSSQDEDWMTTQPPPVRKRCECKPKNECPDAYLDLRYSFFQCSHNTTRCCEPEILPESGVTSENVDIDDLDDDDIIEEEEQKTCFCLPRSNCSESEGWQGDDDPCPGGLIQCCKRADHDFLGPQPIPLPELKIPSTEEVNESEQVPGYAPPPLPTYYNYQSPTHYSGYYYPPQGRPQWSDNPNHQNIPVPPKVYGQDSRSIQSDSLFDKIAKILG